MTSIQQLCDRPGLTGYKTRRCRCPGCRKANSAWQRNRCRQLAYGRWRPFVADAEVRAHVGRLRESGFGAKRIAVLAGVSQAVVARLIWPDRRRAATQRIRSEVAQRILAVNPTPSALAPGAQVDGTGTRRRTQALIALGYSLTRQADMLGRTMRNHAVVLRSGGVTARTAAAVEDLYRRLGATPAPRGQSSTRARNWASREGWPPPMAWEGLDIDDANVHPDRCEPGAEHLDERDVRIAVERVGHGEPVQHLRKAERHEAARRVLAGHVLTQKEARKLLGLTEREAHALARQAKGVRG